MHGFSPTSHPANQDDSTFRTILGIEMESKDAIKEQKEVEKWLYETKLEIR